MAAQYLTQSEMDYIRSLVVVGVDAEGNDILRGPNADGNYSDIYHAIAQLLDEGSDVRRWFEGAEQANAGQG